MSVSDNTDTAAFLAFDMEMAKLINIKASEVAQIVVCSYSNMKLIFGSIALAY